MTATGNSSSRPARKGTGRNAIVSAVAGGMVAVLGVAAIATSSGGAAAAATKPISQSTGRFLSGTIGGMSLDQVAGVEGEKASNPSNPGANANSLNAELLNHAISIPLAKGLQLPDPTGGAVQLGAVAQYAKANGNGSALGASGAVDSNGGIGVAGSKGVPTGGATIDFTGSQLLSAVASTLVDVKLSIGAVSARAIQAKFNAIESDPAASCVNGPYKRVSDNDQAGSYNVASLVLDLKSPGLAQLGSALTSGLSTLLTSLNGALNQLPGGLVKITGIPTAAELEGDLSISLAGGAITASLVDGSLHIDLAKLLTFLGLDINKLCPNSSLLGYLADALAKLPAALGKLVDQVIAKLNSSLGEITVTVGGVPLSLTQLTSIITPLVATLTDSLSTALDSVNLDALQPLIKILTSSLLDITVNGQHESGGTLTETALQVNLLPGGSSLPAPPTLPGLNNFSTAKANKAMQPGIAAVRAALAKRHPSQPGNRGRNGDSYRAVRLVAARTVRVAPVDGLHAAPAAGDPIAQLNLARATVGPNAPRTVTPTPTPITSSPPTTVPPTQVPTGVPAGSGTHGGGTTLPVVLVLLGLVLAGGGAYAYRSRGKYTG